MKGVPKTPATALITYVKIAIFRKACFGNTLKYVAMPTKIVVSIKPLINVDPLVLKNKNLGNFFLISRYR